MKSSNLLILVAITAVVGIVLYSMSGGGDNTDYIAQIEEERKQKDEFMVSGEGSPFEGRATEFKGLKYFPPDAKYRIQANLGPVKDKKMVVLPTSDGKEKRYMEYARATFHLDGADCSLLLLEVMDPGPYKGTLFLAFADETSAVETYGAGRYLDVKKVPGASTIMLDFNQAYNPYCAYSDKFSCPFPPRENVLKAAVLAGEKSYEAH
ncbi:MAG: DUF1684 domain-containing protein [Bacteroidota bacterium]